jgi:hypothetical protein
MIVDIISFLLICVVGIFTFLIVVALPLFLVGVVVLTVLGSINGAITGR